MSKKRKKRTTGTRQRNGRARHAKARKPFPWMKSMAIVLLGLIILAIMTALVSGLFSGTKEPIQTQSATGTKPTAKKPQVITRVEEIPPETQEYTSQASDRVYVDEHFRGILSGKQYEQLRLFTEQTLNPLIMGLVQEGNYPIKAVTQRAQDLARKINKRYKKNLKVVPVLKYGPGESGSIAGASLNPAKDEPLLFMFIPPILDNFMAAKESGSPQSTRAWQNFVVIMINHELEHLAAGDVYALTTPSTPEQGLEIERLAHHNTCLYTTHPIFEAGSPIDMQSMLFYTNWLNAKKDPDSELWRKFIRDIHQINAVYTTQDPTPKMTAEEVFTTTVDTEK